MGEGDTDDVDVDIDDKYSWYSIAVLIKLSGHKVALDILTSKTGAYDVLSSDSLAAKGKCLIVDPNTKHDTRGELDNFSRNWERVMGNSHPSVKQCLVSSTAKRVGRWGGGDDINTFKATYDKLLLDQPGK
jgi:hypothetical protein